MSSIFRFILEKIYGCIQLDLGFESWNSTISPYRPHGADARMGRDLPMVYALFETHGCMKEIP